MQNILREFRGRVAIGNADLIYNCSTDYIAGCYIQFLFTLVIALYYSVLPWFFF